MPHVDQPAQPRRAKRLAAKRRPPGVWMSIMGMLRLPTWRSVRVVYICGTYCMAARPAAMMPRRFAQKVRCVGIARAKKPVVIMTMRAWRMQRAPTVTAVCHRGCGSEGVLSRYRKNTRKRTRLLVSNTCKRVEKTYIMPKHNHCTPSCTIPKRPATHSNVSTSRIRQQAMSWRLSF